MKIAQGETIKEVQTDLAMKTMTICSPVYPEDMHESRTTTAVTRPPEPHVHLSLDKAHHPRMWFVSETAFRHPTGWLTSFPDIRRGRFMLLGSTSAIRTHQIPTLSNYLLDSKWNARWGIDSFWPDQIVQWMVRCKVVKYVMLCKVYSHEIYLCSSLAVGIVPERRKPVRHVGIPFRPSGDMPTVHVTM
ncbi:hypothetical protein D915_007657 [Fasciola hepatica]|uniref:Uncharacterized protein n=1 Tax=Fasciola hepatica TaxID=6192 RepID=A0A4E0RVN6_FASHE|nr:hypothetical protein D915_007657 [Fasciola hepatica]